MKITKEELRQIIKEEIKNLKQILKEMKYLSKDEREVE